MRKRILFLLLFVLMLPQATAFAEEPSDDGGEELDVSIEEGVKTWMDGIDWSGLESALSNMPPEVLALWQNAAFADKTQQIALSDGGEDDTAGLVSKLIGGALQEEKSNLAGLAATLIGLALTGGLSIALAGGKPGGASEASAFVVRCLTLTGVLGAFSSSAALSVQAMGNLCDVMEIATPVLMTLLTAVGSVSGAGVFQPAMALLTDGVGKAMLSIVVPLALCAGVLGMFDQLSERTRLGELSGCIKGGVKWTIGIVTTLYIGITAVRGMTAAARDGITARTAKYAAGSMLPMVGGLVGGSFDTMLGCANLVKNAAGVTVMLLCVSLVMVPMIRLAASLVLFRLTAAVTEPVAERKQTGMLKTGADMLSVLLSAMAAVAAMFLVTVGLAVGLGGGYAG